MIASNISRHQERTSERRDLIGEALFWEQEWFEAHPLICFAGLVMTIVLAGVLEALP